MIEFKQNDREVLDYLHQLQQCIGDVICVLAVKVRRGRQMLALQ